MTSDKKTRRRYSELKKAQVLAECSEPGASVAKVGHATHLSDAAVEEQRLVARVVVAHQAALPGALGAVTEEGPWMLASRRMALRSCRTEA
jgi:hypothetical protein